MTSIARATPRRVVVIGAGVLGVTAAARLAERGVEVVLLSAEATWTTPASRASFAWVNAHGKTPASYRGLNDDARRLHAERSGAHRHPWFVRTGAEIDGTIHADDGYADTDAYLRAHLDDLLRAGGIVHGSTRVRSVAHARELVGPVDLVLVAAGASTVALLGADRSPRLTTSSGDDGFLARIEVARHPVDRILSVGGLQIRPDGEGRVAAQSLAIEAALRRDGTVPSVAAVWPALRDEISRVLSWSTPVDASVRVEHAVRPHAADGLPVIGPVAHDEYVVLSHSGVTLAPLLGELVARDVCGDADPRLAPFRP